jgi:hypothetical protein
MKLPILLLLFATGSLQAQDSLPSWNDTAPKKSIVASGDKVTKEGSSDLGERPSRHMFFFPAKAIGY